PDWDCLNPDDMSPWWGPAIDSVWVLVRVWFSRLGANLSPTEMAGILEDAANAVFDFLRPYERRRGKRYGDEEFVAQWVERHREDSAKYAPFELRPRVDEITENARVAPLEMGKKTDTRKPPFKAFVRMLRSHLEGVLAWTRVRLSSGAVEG